MTDAAAVIEQPAAAPTSNATPPPASALAQEPSALATGGVAPLPIHEQIHEKFRVFSDDEAKTFNLEASTAKLAKAYGELEKRMGAGAELPPESADKYELDGESLGVPDVKAFMADEKNKGFLAKAHAHGMTNKQVQMVVEHALKDFAPDLQTGNAQLKTTECIAQLKTDVWKDEAEYTQNMQAANRLFNTLPESLQAKVDKTLGNDPVFLQIAALIGKEMKEDSPVNNQETPMADGIEDLMKSPAYLDPKDPQHAAVSEKVRAFYQKKYGNTAAM